MKLYNTLSRKVDELIPINERKVGIYSCGPTVYWNQHIGHMYAYVQWDSLVRAFRYLGYEVKWVMNVTDVGHLTSDEDTGEDKMEKGAKREGKTVWEIADKYINQFKESMQLLNITLPDVLSRATEHIDEQIDLIKKIEANGFTYKTSTGLVFDTAKFSDYAKFANLNLEEQKSGARVEVDKEKKNPWDFLLWVTNQPSHVMKWDSPWGVGFPGWHIECTAMSVKYLGEKFDIHTGGKEHIPVHHTNEIAQGYGAFGTQTANYWLHNEWLLVEGEKMAKSLGNNILVTDLIEKGFDPLALRYLILNSHYRQGLNFNWDALAGAQKALDRLNGFVASWSTSGRNSVSPQKTEMIDEWNLKFRTALDNDLNMPQALATVWEMAKSMVPGRDKLELILSWDEVLGLHLDQATSHKTQIPIEVMDLIKRREEARKSKDFAEADRLRREIEARGYLVNDTGEGTKVVHAIK